MSSVLIVDDHVDTCEALRRLLQLCGTRAHCVHSGLDALAYVRSLDPPSVIVLDVSMPEMDGIETLLRLRAGGFAGAVVMFTAISDERSRRRAMDAGATEYLVKGSLEPAWITRAICRHIRHLASPGDASCEE